MTNGLRTRLTALKDGVDECQRCDREERAAFFADFNRETKLAFEEAGLVSDEQTKAALIQEVQSEFYLKNYNFFWEIVAHQ